MNCAFSKLHGAGNDFVMIEDLKDEIEISPESIAKICDRHFGVGADGLILVKPPKTDDGVAYMEYYNADGTTAQMCGNGIRCFAKFLVDGQIAKAGVNPLVIDTIIGPREVTVHLADDGCVDSACVDMGMPILRPKDIPTTLCDTADRLAPVLDAVLSVGDALYKVTCVSMGNPHAVVFVDDPFEYPVEKVGPIIEKAPEFPEFTNVEFAHADGDVIEMRIWERGCGETLACGSGSCATAVAANLTGRAGRHVSVKVLGGVLDVDWRENDHVYMSGPAELVYSGTVDVF